MSSILFFCVSFFASIAGAICGIGGGVIIKPVLDMLGLASVATISFLSGCTVLSMSCYTVGKNIAAGDNRVDFRTGTPLAIGAAVGGVVGKQLFSTIAGMFPNPNTVGVVQSICLAIITIGTFVYTLFKARIQGKHITNLAFCVIIGLVLGLMSSFLGIGGGPINLVVLFYFFSMQRKMLKWLEATDDIVPFELDERFTPEMLWARVRGLVPPEKEAEVRKMIADGTPFPVLMGYCHSLK